MNKVLEDFRLGHRPHQLDIIKITNEKSFGQIISPCGTGKTRAQQDLLINCLLERNEINELGVVCISSHRLILNSQLLEKVVDLGINSGLKLGVLFIGSGQKEFTKLEDEIFYKYRAKNLSPDTFRINKTLSSEEVNQFINFNKSNDFHTIIVSTYHSIDKLKDNKVDLATFDEAHNLVQKNFHDNYLAVSNNISRKFFFTATRRIDNEDGGMNDKDIFGEVIYEAHPKDMIRDGEIVRPYVIQIFNKNIKNKKTNISEDEKLAYLTIESFKKINLCLKKYSINSNLIGNKFLIAGSGINTINGIANSNILKRFAKKNKINIIVIHSGGCSFNYETYSKEECVSKMNRMNDNEHAIIFNVDMLIEGIDLPGITGVMPLRNLGKTKLIQLVGRALRLMPNDRNKLYSNKLEPSDCDNKKFIKPFGCVVFPYNTDFISDVFVMEKTIVDIYCDYKGTEEYISIIEKYFELDDDSADSVIDETNSNEGDEKYLEFKEYCLDDSISSSFIRNTVKLSLQEKIKRIFNSFEEPHE